MKKIFFLLFCIFSQNAFSLSLDCKEPAVFENEITEEIVEWHYSFGDFYIFEEGVLIEAIIKPKIEGNKFSGLVINIIENGSVKYSFDPATRISEKSIVASLVSQKKLLSNHQFIITYSDKEYCPTVIYRYTGRIPEKK
ncbi:hypothetical protein [Zobellella iuensis]|uniref:Uncharacterized protein n=1 Tax=Zobellella iuensis TaxID=2803811 RepID=A0ABS1QMG5_9GAMM|nr:hypothetical protein [Zobellella iuensis]MBL1376045.1 hypothetical protein [Zobellella iuensis]